MEEEPVASVVDGVPSSLTDGAMDEGLDALRIDESWNGARGNPSGPNAANEDRRDALNPPDRIEGTREVGSSASSTLDIGSSSAAAPSSSSRSGSSSTVSGCAEVGATSGSQGSISTSASRSAYCRQQGVNSGCEEGSFGCEATHCAAQRATEARIILEDEWSDAFEVLSGTKRVSTTSRTSSAVATHGDV